MRTKLMMLALVTPVLLLSACGGDNATAPTPIATPVPTPAPTPVPINVTGNWSMIGNNYKFTLSLTQTGTVVTGIMDSLSTKEANTPVDGFFDGTAIVFTRHGANYTQVYTGTVSSDGSRLTGTFRHNASTATYPWTASR
jgi:hypothetical protein